MTYSKKESSLNYLCMFHTLMKVSFMLGTRLIGYILNLLQIDFELDTLLIFMLCTHPDDSSMVRPYSHNTLSNNQVTCMVLCLLWPSFMVLEDHKNMFAKNICIMVPLQVVMMNSLYCDGLFHLGKHHKTTWK